MFLFTLRRPDRMNRALSKASGAEGMTPRSYCNETARSYTVGSGMWTRRGRWVLRSFAYSKVFRLSGSIMSGADDVQFDTSSFTGRRS